jgi:uncharacterized protein (UPF0548 family)
MARSCIFCGAQPTTREHAWPDWLRRKLATEEAVRHTNLLEQGGDVTELRAFDDRPYKVTAKVVCEKCNGGWMGRLEDGAKSILSGMVDGRGRELHAGGQSQLSSWALLKAIIFDQAAPIETRVLFPEFYAELFSRGRPPRDGCRIYLGAYGGEMLGFTGMTALATSTAGQPYDGERNVCVRTFSMGRVVFQVFATSNPALMAFDVDWATVGQMPPQVVRIWPPGPSVRWMPEPSLGDDGLIWFANHVVATLIQQSETFNP